MFPKTQVAIIVAITVYTVSPTSLSAEQRSLSTDNRYGQIYSILFQFYSSLCTSHDITAVTTVLIYLFFRPIYLPKNKSANLAGGPIIPTLQNVFSGAFRGGVQLPHWLTEEPPPGALNINPQVEQSCTMLLVFRRRTISYQLY